MTRARLAGAVVLLAALVAPAVTSGRVDGFHPTHRISVVGKLVNHWTLKSSGGSCHPVGSGSLTVNFRTAKSFTATPAIDPTSAPSAPGPVTRAGRWILFTPGGGVVADAPSQRAVGTIELVDDTTLTPNSDGTPCNDPEKADRKNGCGTQPLRKGFIKLGGYDRRHLSADLAAVLFDFIGAKNCETGNVTDFGGVSSARDRLMLLRMPTPKALAGKRVTVLTRTDHAQGTDAPFIEDVTRTVTVTLTRIR